MNDKEQQKLMDEKYKALPGRLKGALDSDVVEAVSDTVADKYNLQSDAADKLDDLIRLTILGLSDPKEFTRKLVASLDVDGQTATAIAQEVNERVFQPIRQDLLILYGSQGGYSREKNAPTSTLNPAPSTLSSQPSFTKPLHSKSLAAELAESAGLRPTPPVPRPPVPTSKPIDTELQETLRRPTVPVPPPPPADATGYTLQATRPAPPPPPRPRPSPVFTTPQQPSQPVVPAAKPWTTPPPAKPRTFENSFGENQEEVLSREEILRGIENPASAQPTPPQFGAPLPEPPEQYDKDPYREPLQ